MTENKIYTYNPDGTRAGLEATYMLSGDALYVKIPGSNHWRDYAACLIAWPMVQHNRQIGLYHRIWWQMAWDLFCRIWSDLEDPQQYDLRSVEIMGHSMGGAVGVLLGAMIPLRINRKVTAINAPKCGDRAAMWAVRSTGMELHALHDRGDLVHHLPLFYARYPERSRREYAHTRGIGASHNNMPPEWKEFTI